MDIGAWLRELNLERYEPAFQENDIDFAILPDLDGDDLKELGVHSLGHRKRLLKAIAEIAGPSADGTSGHRDLTPSTATPVQPAQPHAAERRQLTVMFVDLVGSTEMSANLDPEDMSEVILSYQNTVAGEIGRFEGHVAKFMGDGVLAYFGYPRAHEDEAERAVRAALSLTGLIDRLAAPDGRRLSARFGIATGLVVVGDLVGEGAAQEQAVVGDTPNLAARLQSIAAPGQVVIAEASRKLLSTGFVVEALGPQDLKGIGSPVPAFAVTGERSVESRFDSMTGNVPLPMVARDQELALLMERWALARGGEGQCVLLTGEAGIGKSRICRALMDELAGAEIFRLRYQCSPFHGESALWPVIQQITKASGIANEDRLEERLDKLDVLLDLGGERNVAPLFATLIGLDGTGRYGALALAPQVQRARTLGALVAQLQGLAARRPVLMILEDAHWIDPTTLEMIELCLDSIARARVMIVITTRPEGQPALTHHPSVAPLALNRLGRSGVEAIIAKLGRGQLPDEIVAGIVARADGVPLFAEELTKAMLESSEASIPTTLHDSLLARLDRVTEAKEVAQIAACVGREFDYPLLSALSGRSDTDLDDALERLTAAELIFRRGTATGRSYVFKHALVRDAAYESLLRSRRQRLHARTAEVLEDGDAATSAAPDLLAHHYTEAGLVEPAIRNWQIAGEQAAKRAANIEAIHHFKRALELLKELSEDRARETTEFEVLTRLGPALMVVKGWAAPEVREVYERAHELAVRLEGSADLVAPLIGIWLYHNARAHYDRADKLTDELFQVARSTADDGLLLQAHHAAWPIPMFKGEFRTSRDHVEQGVEIYDGERHKDHALIYMGHDPAVCAHVCGSKSAWALGFPEQARGHAEEGLALARRLGHAPTLAFALWYLAGAHAARGDLQTTLVAAEEAQRLSEQEKLAQTEAGAQCLGGWAIAMSGQSDEGLALIDRGLGTWDRSGTRTWSQVFQSLRAEVLIGNGRYNEALKIIEVTLRYSQETGENWWTSRLHHLRGDAHLHTGDRAGAMASLETAIEVAAAQDAQSWQLRAATRLARLWAEGGRQNQARELLAPIYGGFTEGFETPHLQAARQLLDGLG